MLGAVVLASTQSVVPVPNARQLEFMDLELTQFMHFGIPTFWDAPSDFLHGANPTFHDCHNTNVDTGNQTAGYFPCLNPNVFHPTDLNAENWMEASAALGMREIVLTAHHEGGFALWPSKFTPYSVAASSWRGGKGDVLREFADAANKWGIGISYYLNVQDDGYMVSIMKNNCSDFTRRQVGMVTEVLTQYGPVNRFWFDGTSESPCKDVKGGVKSLWQAVYDTIRKVSPATMITPYRGDVCAADGGKTIYTNNGPAPNSTDTSLCQPLLATGDGKYFHPTEEHRITIQEGPDGNTDEQPTYWFWHPWACAGNVTGCPWVGHANASRIFDSYLVTVGRGATLNMNIPPERTGQMNASVFQVMVDAGTAINNTFHTSVAATPAGQSIAAQCGLGVATLTIPEGAEFDYVVSMEDMVHGARFANNSIDYQLAGSTAWEVLVPPCGPAGCPVKNGTAAARIQKVKLYKTRRNGGALGDRPDGHDPRDSHIGHKRIDLPEVPTRGAKALKIAKIRLNCIEAWEEPVYVRSFSVHKKSVPWEQ